jgi:putative transposase
MPYDPRFHHRRSIRLPGYDYTRAGGYFITLVTYRRACLFGDIVRGEMRLNDWGQIAADCWRAIPEHYDNVGLDEFTIMPNHIHGIIVIFENGHVHPHSVGATQWVAPTKTGTHTDCGTRDGNTTLPPCSIGSIIGQFKSITTKRINQYWGLHGMPIWQRNYYEHIIRNDGDLLRIRVYIHDNPARWATNVENGLNPTGNRAG